MSTTPGGYTTVAPWIVTPDTRKLLEFIAQVFDGVELARVPLEDGSIGHAEIRVGNTVLLAFDQREGWSNMPALLRVFVADADATTQAAVNAGATLVTPPPHPGVRAARRQGPRPIRQHLVDHRHG